LSDLSHIVVDIDSFQQLTYLVMPYVCHNNGDLLVSFERHG